MNKKKEIHTMNNHPFSRLFIILILLILMAGCSNLTEGKSTAEAKITEFHSDYNEDNFETIYQNAHADLKKATSFEDFKEFMTAVHRKLGDSSSTTNQTWNIGNYNLITTVRMVQETSFEHGTGIETFTFKIKNQKASLTGYNINSKTLIIN